MLTDFPSSWLAMYCAAFCADPAGIVRLYVPVEFPRFVNVNVTACEDDKAPLIVPCEIVV